MSKKRIEVIPGIKYSRLTVIEETSPYFAPSGGQKRRVKCKCDCGKNTIVMIADLRRGNSTSCGCKRTEHGMTKTRLYRIWSGMKQRCYNSKDKKYHRYGGRGIKVFDQWMDFMSFYNWAMKNGYQSVLTLDREENDGDYMPNNCRWVTMEVQSNNTSRNVRAIVNGEQLTLAEIGKKYKTPKTTIIARFNKGLRGVGLITYAKPKRTLINSTSHPSHQ